MNNKIKIWSPLIWTEHTNFPKRSLRFCTFRFHIHVIQIKYICYKYNNITEINRGK